MQSLTPVEKSPEHMNFILVGIIEVDSGLKKIGSKPKFSDSVKNLKEFVMGE